MKITNRRRWRDYLYLADDFKNYSGKKFSGQRNHVNKFKKLYPQYKFLRLSGHDKERITGFLKLFERRQLSKGTVMAREELEGVYKLIPHIDDFNLCVGALEDDGNIVAISIENAAASN